MSHFDPATERYCRACATAKPISAFYAADKWRCKACKRRDAKEWRDANLDRARRYDKQRALLPHRRANMERVVAAWKALYPKRRAAQVALGNAIRDGKVTPWPLCAVPECNEKPVAHHPDYSRPLDVVWLCQAHHKQAHALARRAA